MKGRWARRFFLLRFTIAEAGLAFQSGRMSNSVPTVLGLRKSFGFGDRLGSAGKGHLAALKQSGFAGVLAQQSIRELTRTGRTADEVMEAARRAIADEGYNRPWGVDADHLKTKEDVARMAEAGYTFFTIDPSEFVNNHADGMAAAELAPLIRTMENEGILAPSWRERLLGKSFETECGLLQFDRESLERAAVKYARAVAHCQTMAGFMESDCGGRDFEIEVSVDETDSPTSPLEHLFFALGLRERGVRVVSLAPRFVGDFEKGIDYRGDRQVFEENLRWHAAIARAFGPYKLSIHSGSDKFSIYPVIGRVCGDLLHVKTAGTSYLEALRVVIRADRELAREILLFSASRFAEDRASYHISTSLSEVEKLSRTGPNDLEPILLGTDGGRQLLHVTFGSVLTIGKTSGGQSFKEAVNEVLEGEADLHAEVLERHLGKHLALLEEG